MQSPITRETKQTYEPSARFLLIEWANGQDNWLRAIVSETVATRKELSTDQAREIYALYLREKELAPGDGPTVSLLSGAAGAIELTETFLLKSLEDLRQVNAISPGQRIEFNPKLTVGFGENAAGKTGYVRVLKRVAAVRTAEVILPNLAGGAEAIEPPGARLTYKLGGREKQMEWKNEAGVSPFNRMDVFDSSAATVHLDEELAYVYTPGELALFPLVQLGIEQIHRLLDNDIRTKSATSNPYTGLFDRRSRIYPKIESLGAGSDLHELQKLARLSREDDERYVSLEIEINALRSSTPQAQLALVENRVRALSAFLPMLEAIQQFDYAHYREACEAVRTAEQRHDESSRSAFSGLAIPGILGEEWRRFIEAGEEYLKVTNTAGYPSNDDLCIYCQQPLTSAATALVQKYREYCSNASRIILEATRKALAEITEAIEIQTPERLKDLIDECERDSIGHKLALRPLAEELDTARKAALAREEWSWSDLARTAKETRGRIDKEVADGNILIGKLRAETKNRDEALREREAAFVELGARRLLAKHLLAIDKYINDARWIDKGRAQSKRFSVTLKSLTDTAKIASDQLLNQDFGKRFEKECEKLRAPRVRLEFPGRQGQVVRRKAVIAGHRLSETLSEGEQKVIALADFLAETSLKRTRAPVVFDDPITSLDYKRIREVAGRILDLSKERQVIVFTHNIWFATELLSRFEDSPGDCSYYDIRSEGESFGLVSKGTHPRADTFKTDRAMINEVVQHAKKATGSVQDALIEKGYEYLRNVCEIIVETDLLRGVTQRYQPNVMMTKLPQIKTDRLQAAIDGIMPIF